MRFVLAQRNILRIVTAIVAIAAFCVLQVWQGEDIPVPTGTDQSAEKAEPKGFIYATSSTSTSGKSALVTRVVDGDTIVVRIDETGEEATVRLLGINTPESVDPRRPVQCFGKEASHSMQTLVEGKKILLFEDVQADDRDKYRRLLRNVVRADDGLDVNATLVNTGYAYAYLSFPLNPKRKALLRTLEASAHTDGRGLWNVSTCGGKK